MFFRKRPIPHPMILEDSWPVRRRNPFWARLLLTLILGAICFLLVGLV
jgi:hypothetical protein